MPPGSQLLNIKLPSTQEFKALLGRSGRTRSSKRNDHDPIFSALEQCDAARLQIGPSVIPVLRALRRACIAWLQANKNTGRSTEPAVMDLLDRAQARFLAICELAYAGVDRGQDMTRAAAEAARPRLPKGLIGSELHIDQSLEAARGVHWGGLGAGKAMTSAHDAYKRGGGSLSMGALAESFSTRKTTPTTRSRVALRHRDTVGPSSCLVSTARCTPIRMSSICFITRASSLASLWPVVVNSA